MTALRRPEHAKTHGAKPHSDIWDCLTIELGDVTNRVFSLAPIISALMTALYLPVSPGITGFEAVGLTVAVALITWVIWHWESGDQCREKLPRTSESRSVRLGETHIIIIG
jgi:hypothetical protein